MIVRTILTAGLLLPLGGCTSAARPAATRSPSAQIDPSVSSSPVDSELGRTADGEWRGFDRNDYPGDEIMARLHRAGAGLAFTGYWLTNPPGETSNSWVGKRAVLRAQGWGFLLLANGRLDAELLKAQRTGTRPAALGQQDAARAAASAQHEGFAPGTVLFLDQEEGGRLLPEQAAYLLAWTESVAAHGFQPGVYASGQSVEDSPGVTIDTIQDIRTRVSTAKLHQVSIFDALDQCPPAPGCTVAAKPLRLAPDAGIVAWQYAQSPRRPEITKSCGSTYAADGNCYLPGFPQLFLDMDVANSPDPSKGR